MRIICKTELRAFHKTTILKHKGPQRASCLLEDGGEAGKPGGENGKHYLVVSKSLLSGAGKQYKDWHFIQ